MPQSIHSEEVYRGEDSGDVRTLRPPSSRSSPSTPPSPPCRSSSPSSSTTTLSAPPNNDIEDIWESSTTEPGWTDPSDIPRLRSIHSTAGYRDGISTARDAAAQPGFDEGYLLGAPLGLRAGHLIGLMEALMDGVSGQLPGVGEKGDGECGDGGAEWQEGGRRRDSTTGKRALTLLLAEMRKELSLQSLLGREWIAEDGTWAWEVGDVSEMHANAAPGSSRTRFATAPVGELDATPTGPDTINVASGESNERPEGKRKDGEANEEDADDGGNSIGRVASWHPLLRKWGGTVGVLLQAAGVQERAG